MKSIKFARVIFIVAVIFLLAGIGQMLASTLHKIPLKIEPTAEQSELLQGINLEFGEYHSNILAHNISDMAIVDGKVQKRMLFALNAERSLEEEQLLQRFPLWNRPNLNRYRNFVKLDGETLYYREEWKRLSETDLNQEVRFNYILVSDTENQFKEYSVTVPFKLPLSWSEQAFFQRKGDQLAVIFPVRISQERDSYHVFASFVLSLKEGKVLESKVLGASLENEKLVENTIDDTLHPVSQVHLADRVREERSYNPEMAMIQLREGKGDEGEGAGPGHYYQFDYFTMTLRRQAFAEKDVNTHLTTYVTGKNIYVVTDAIGLPDESPYSQRASSSSYLSLDKRQGTALKLYHVKDPSTVELMAELSQDPYAIRPILNKNYLAYIQLKNQKNAIAIYDLVQNKEVATVPIQYDEGAQVFYQNSRLY